MHYSKVLKWLKEDIGVNEGLHEVSIDQVMEETHSYSIDENGNVTGLNLTGSETINHLFDLKNIGTLKRLNLSNCNICKIKNLSVSIDLTHLALRRCGYEFEDQIEDESSFSGTKRYYGFVPFDTRCLKELTNLIFLDLTDTQYRPRVTNQSHVYFGDLEDILQASGIQELLLGEFFIKDDLNKDQRETYTELKEIAKFKRLKKLDISGNYLEEDLSFLSSLKEIISLDLSGNRIEEITLDFVNSFPRLQELFLYQNPIINIPKEFFDRKENVLESVNTYLRSLTKIEDAEVIHIVAHGAYDSIPKFLSPAPYPPIFVGRAKELDTIHEKLTSTSQTQLLVWGEGGIGKTSLVATYFQNFSSEYRYLAWIYARDMNGRNIFSSITQAIAESLKISLPNHYRRSDSLEFLLQEMRKLQKPCLLVIDEVDTLQDMDSLYPILSGLPNFQILLTSRNADLTQIFPIETLKLGPLRKESAFYLFKKLNPRLPTDQIHHLERIIDYVEGHPLAISLLARTMSYRTLENYNLEDLFLELQNKGLSELTKNRITGTLRKEISERESTIQFDLSSLEANERAVISSLALLPQESIELNVLKTLLPNLQNLEESLLRLSKRGWVEYKPDKGSIMIHPVVQKVVVNRNPSLLLDCEDLLVSLISMFEYEGGTGHLTKVNYKEAELYARYAKSIISFTKSANDHILILCERIGNYHKVTGNLNLALAFFEDFSTFSKEFHEDAPSDIDKKRTVALSFFHLGEINSSLGNLDIALGYFEEEAKILEEILEDYPQKEAFKNSLVISYSKIGETLSSLGDWVKVQKYYEKSLILSKELYEAYPQNVSFKSGLAISYSKLGESHSALGNLEQALKYFEEYWHLAKELYEAYPQNVSFKNGLAISYSKLGESHSALGNLEQALKYFEEDLHLTKELYEAYPQNVSFKNGLAISYSKLGESHSALGNLEQTLVFYENGASLTQELYEAYPQNVSFKNGLASSYSRLASTFRLLDFSEKASYFFDIQNQLLNELCEAYPQNVSFKNNLAYSFYNIGSLNQAIGNFLIAKSKYEEAIKIFEEIQKRFPNFSYNFQTVSEIYRLLGEVNVKLGDKKEGLKNLGAANKISIEGNQNIIIQSVESSSVQISKNVVTGNIIASENVKIGDLSERIEELNTSFLHQAKMILIGNPETGKSSIVFRLFDKENSLPSRTETQGLEVVNKNYVIKKLQPSLTSLTDEIDFTLQIWDFGGQGKYREVQNLFCSRKSLYLFVTSVDDKPTNDDYIGYEYWLSMAKTFGYDKLDDTASPIIHVLNKIDLPHYKGGAGLHFDITERNPYFENFVTVSCEKINDYKSNFEHFENIIRSTLPKIGKDENDTFGTKFRNNWFEVKVQLETKINEGAHYIPYNEYRNLCFENDLDEKEAKEWITYLDRIGTLIYFEDNEKLKDWVFLSPKWVKDAFCKIVDSELIKENQGKLTQASRDFVWSDYKKEDRIKFIDLMLANGFCYFDGNNFIIPACLPNSPPNFPEALNTWDVELAYSYDPFVPAGTVNRLIARHHKKIYSYEEELKWKNGCVLHDIGTNSFIRIIENWKNKRVEVSIKSSDYNFANKFVGLELEKLNQELKDAKFLDSLRTNVIGKYKTKYYIIEDLEEMNEAKKKFWFLFGEKKSMKKITNMDSKIPDFFITEMKKQFEDEYKKIQRFEKLLSDMDDEEKRKDYEKEIQLSDSNIARIEKRYFGRIKAQQPEMDEAAIQSAINNLKTSMLKRFDKVDKNIERLQLSISGIQESINENSVEGNPVEKEKAEQLLQEIKIKLDRLPVPGKEEVLGQLKGDISTSAKLKLTIPLIPGILKYESDLLKFSAKEPIKSWKDLWQAFFVGSKDDK